MVMVAQPAEEAVDGAQAMLDDGLYSRFPKPDFALALHCRPDEPIGTVSYCSGPTLASSTSISLTIRGKGGHGAWPHRTVDPIVLAALVIVDMQTIVSREIDPSEPAVVTVGSIHGGTKHNIIPDQVKLQLTLRSFSESVRQQLIAGIKRRAIALAQAHQAPEPTVEIEEGTPPTINTPALVERLVPAFVEVLGPANVNPAKPVMGAEDFSLFSSGERADLHVLAGHPEPRAARGGRRERRNTAARSTPRNTTPNRAPASPPASAPRPPRSSSSCRPRTNRKRGTFYLKRGTFYFSAKSRMSPFSIDAASCTRAGRQNRKNR